MDELIQKLVDQFGYPADMVVRSAEARAKADGTSVEAVLAAWTGGEAPAAATPPAAAPAGDAPAAPAPAPPAAPTGPAVEVLGPVDDAAAEESDQEAEPSAADEEEPDEELAAAGSGIPLWLAASFIILPLIALTYALFSPNGPSCGEGSVLAVDAVTGEAVNCDGSAYGVDQVDFSEIGRTVYAANCAACHGAGGAGGALFPAFTGGALLTVFPSGQCQNQVDWVALGTANWPDATYGATEKPVGGSGGVMPGFENSLTPEELRSVVLYERVAFGGQDPAEAPVDCGLLTPEGEPMAAG